MISLSREKPLEEGKVIVRSPLLLSQDDHYTFTYWLPFLCWAWKTPGETLHSTAGTRRGKECACASAQSVRQRDTRSLRSAQRVTLLLLGTLFGVSRRVQLHWGTDYTTRKGAQQKQDVTLGNRRAPFDPYCFSLCPLLVGSTQTTKA